MSKKTLIALLIVVAVLAIAVSLVGAITDGELDGDGHPHVVLLLMEVGGEPMYDSVGEPQVAGASAINRDWRVLPFGIS